MSRSRDLKVGIFVVLGLVMATLVVFLIGDERRLFSSSQPFHTSFEDVAGLKAGAPVRMGGIDIGHVDKVGYSTTDPKDTTIYVEFSVVKAEVGRVRTDSKARISTKGLLGDKVIELTTGTTDESVKPGSEIPSEAPKDLFERVGAIATKAETVMDNIAKATEPLADEKLHRDIQGSVSSMNSILHEIAHGDGYPNRLISDPAEADRISGLIASLEKTSLEAQLTIRNARHVVGRVESGPGFAHEVIYGDGPKGLAEVSNAANEVALTLKGIRESDSLVHDALYGGKGDGAEALRNVTAITADVRAIVADMRAGKGTIGGLLVDPSIYEDVKSVLGNVQRNDVLRALVRYSIKADEQKPGVNVAGPK